MAHLELIDCRVGIIGMWSSYIQTEERGRFRSRVSVNSCFEVYQCGLSGMKALYKTMTNTRKTIKRDIVHSIPLKTRRVSIHSILVTGISVLTVYCQRGRTLSDQRLGG